MSIDSKTGIWDLETAKTRHRFDPSLAENIARLFSPVLAADLGCGAGEYCRAFKEHGWPAVHGYEGTPEIAEIAVHDNIQVLDLAKRRWVGINYDFVLCLEVGEHIPPEHEGTFIENVVEFTHQDLVLSWAVPGQGGTAHVNERSNEYVIGRFTKYGLVYDDLLSQGLRNAATLKWFKKTVMVFRRR